MIAAIYARKSTDQRVADEERALTLMRMSEIRSSAARTCTSSRVILLPKVLVKVGTRPVILRDAARRILRGQLEAHTDVVFPQPDEQSRARAQLAPGSERQESASAQAERLLYFALVGAIEAGLVRTAEDTP